MRALISLMLAVLIIGGGLAYGETPERKQITVSAQWKLGPSTAYWVIAKEKGFYDDLGFKVNLVGLMGSTKTIVALQAGQVDMGCPSGYALVQARGTGFKAKMLLCYVPMPQLGVIYHTNRGINSPKDLEGKTIGGVPGTGDLLLLPSYCKYHGVDFDKIKIENLSYAVLHGMFFEGKLDGIATFMPYLPRFRNDGHKVNAFPYEDYNVYFNGLSATDKFIKENPVTVRRFVQATQKAFVWIYENPKEAIDLYFKAQPELKGDNPDVDYEAFKLVMSTQYDQTSKIKGVGWMTAAKWEKTMQFAAEHFEAETNFAPNEIFTNEFLLPIK